MYSELEQELIRKRSKAKTEMNAFLNDEIWTKLDKLSRQLARIESRLHTQHEVNKQKSVAAQIRWLKNTIHKKTLLYRNCAVQFWKWITGLSAVHHIRLVDASLKRKEKVKSIVWCSHQPVLSLDFQLHEGESLVGQRNENGCNSIWIFTLTLSSTYPFILCSGGCCLWLQSDSDSSGWTNRYWGTCLYAVIKSCAALW